MHISVRRKLLGAALSSILGGYMATATAASTPISANVDLGLATPSQPAQITLHLNLHNQAALEKFIHDSVTPGNASYHKFLTASEFAAQYGATDAEIAKVQSFLQSQGLNSEVSPNHLTVRSTGTIAQVSTAFKTTIHTAISANGQRFSQPLSKFVVPTSLDGIVHHVSGLGPGRTYQSHLRQLPKASQALNASLSAAAKAADSGNPTATGAPELFTVGDVANMYNINPLYDRGIDGSGSTIAIIALSGFSPSDPVTYWKAIALSTKPDRITTIAVDGGAALDGNNSETALDIEQAGGIAPQADILVYEAPNGGSAYPNGFTDALEQAVTDNIADTISISWGNSELFNFASVNSGGTGPTDTTDEGDLETFHALFLEAAAQGQTVFSAAGDAGAYDTVRGLCDAPNKPFSECIFSAPLTVDSPASDPYVTAAGGTTTPVTLTVRSTGEVLFDIKKERVWSWDYLIISGNGISITRDDVFSSGGGGGVSVYWPVPDYQKLTRGIRVSAADQSLIETDAGEEPYTYSILPANFKGRNVPDISFNADPETGYLTVSSLVSKTGKVTPGVISIGGGGTSYVAPQLAGVAALLKHSTKGRVGFLNPVLYKLFNSNGYGSWTPFNAISTGNNWYYNGLPIYNPGAGIGTLNVTNFDTFLHAQ